MKKLVCLILALALCMSVTAMAENVPSKTTTDLTKFTVSAANQPAGAYLMPISELKLDGTLPAHEEHTAILQKEIAKLSSEGAESYFANVTDSEGKPVDLRKELGLDANAKLNVSEFFELVAGGFNEDCGNVTATMLFPTPYEKDEKVYVLVGIVDEQNDGAVTWQAFEGVGMADGSVKAEFTPEIVKAIANGIALLAIVSK